MTTKYAIIFHPRSGSSWLSNILAQTPSILHAYELLDKSTAIQLGFLEPSILITSATEQLRILDKFYSHAEIHKRAVAVAGFKVAPYQMLGPGELVQRLRFIDAKIILMWRDNILATAISQIGACRMTKKYGEANATQRENVQGSITVEKDELIYYLIEQMLERERVKSFASLFEPENLLCLQYERMLENTQAVLGSISKFLGIEITETSDPQ